MDLQEYIHNIYQTQDNYKVIDTPDAIEPDLAVIYFSSVGLYSEKNCISRLDNDYYEFHRNRVQRAGRHIYIRDVALAVYLNGINSRYDNIEKVLELLKELTAGYKVVTLGVSGGGFMAMLAGVYLQAEYAISVSGVVRLGHVEYYFEQMPSWVRWRDPERRQYFNIVNRIKDSDLPIFQFEAGRCPEDIENIALMAPVKGRRLMTIDYAVHAGEIDPPALGQIINMTRPQLEKLFERFKGQMIPKSKLTRTVLSYKQLGLFYLKKLRKNLLKVKISRKGSLIVLLGFTLLNTTGNSEIN